jgi:hypothetical protein
MIEDSKYFKVVDAAYPGISKKIKVFWGYPEFVELMFDLQNDFSLRPRVGFPADVLMALHELGVDHDAIYPHLVRVETNVWGVSANSLSKQRA